MHKIFKQLPLDSVKSILDSVYKGEKSGIPELEEIINKELSPSTFFLSLTEQDRLTGVVYNNTDDGRIVYPKESKSWFKKGPDPHVGFVGDQTSKSHKENLAEHTALMLGRLSNLSLFNPLSDMILLTALYHDRGKKYTGVTTDKPKLTSDDAFMSPKGRITGQVDFPDSNPLSAYLYSRELKELGFKRDEIEKYVAAIYHIDKRDENLVKEYGDEAIEVYSSLVRSNVGIPSYIGIKEAGKEIYEGKRLILERLDPFVINLSSREPANVAEISQKFFMNSQSDEFEKHAIETDRLNAERLLQEEIREKHRKEYEEILEAERVRVEEQRRLEKGLVEVSGAMIGSLASGLTFGSVNRESSESELENKQDRNQDLDVSR